MARGSVFMDIEIDFHSIIHANRFNLIECQVFCLEVFYFSIRTLTQKVILTQFICIVKGKNITVPNCCEKSCLVCHRNGPLSS